jgi:hypothetical protein
MKKVFIRVSGATITHMFTTGKINYEIFEGLPSGCKLQSVMRDLSEDDMFILFFETNIPENDNEIRPKIKVYDACR